MSEVIILNKDNPAVKYLCTKDKRLSKVIDTIGEISLSDGTLWEGLTAL